MTSDWRDGFLFVGNRLSLDFLNTRPLIDGRPVELLPNEPALDRWLRAAGFVPKVTGPVEELRQFRERLRKVVIRMEAGGRPSKSFVDEVNSLLQTHPHPDQIVESPEGLTRSKTNTLRTASEILAPIVDDVAALLTMPDKKRLRMCEHCILHFHDTSKKGTRRWCSMNLCGNRSKVAAYAQRQKILGAPRRSEGH